MSGFLPWWSLQGPKNRERIAGMQASIRVLYICSMVTWGCNSASSCWASGVSTMLTSRSHLVAFNGNIAWQFCTNSSCVNTVLEKAWPSIARKIPGSTINQQRRLVEASVICVMMTGWISSREVEEEASWLLDRFSSDITWIQLSLCAF